MTVHSGKAHLEENAEAYLHRQVRLLGGKTIKVVPITAGWPDRLVLLPGGTMDFVELKRDDTDLSEIQRIRHAELARIGITVVVLHGKAEVKAWIASRFDALGPQSRPRGRPRKSVG